MQSVKVPPVSIQSCQGEWVEVGNWKSLKLEVKSLKSWPIIELTAPGFLLSTVHFKLLLSRHREYDRFPRHLYTDGMAELL